jgi:hypothetical protein
MRVSEGTRTPDRLDHNQELYQLSYAHRETVQSTSAGRWGIFQQSVCAALISPSGARRNPPRTRVGAGHGVDPLVQAPGGTLTPIGAPVSSGSER